MSETVAERNLEHARQLLLTMNEGGSKAVLARMEEFAQPEVEWRGWRPDALPRAATSSITAMRDEALLGGNRGRPSTSISPT
jgi:hypothetical protein